MCGACLLQASTVCEQNNSQNLRQKCQANVDNGGQHRNAVWGMRYRNTIRHSCCTLSSLDTHVHRHFDIFAQIFLRWRKMWQEILVHCVNALAYSHVLWLFRGSCCCCCCFCMRARVCVQHICVCTIVFATINVESEIPLQIRRNNSVMKIKDIFGIPDIVFAKAMPELSKHLAQVMTFW